MPNTIENPFVGPRTFEEKDSEFFFGRDREARELLSQVIAEPLVVFYAQSGAGKSSLINTRLVPGLREEGFEILPLGRVSGELPEGIAKVDNIFVFNLLLSLNQDIGLAEDLTGMSLAKYLDAVVSEPEEEVAEEEPADEGYDDYEEASRVLIIDQFEEIFTTHLDRWQDRKGFFRQLRQALNKDSYLWVVLSMREDYVAALAPYAKLLPGKLRANFHMQRMGYQAARDVIEQTAQKGGRPFARGVAKTLVDNLRQLQVAADDEQTRLGEFVEPVQLQVVCYQLWQNLKDRPPGEITHQDLQELGDVDKALAQFYEQALEKAIEATGASEIDVRSWFETKLITEAGTRGTVYQGSEQTGGLDNETVQLLADQFLLRAEIRGGGTWYELVHDRFVPPILQANLNWRLKQPLIQVAQAWADSGRSKSRLLGGQQLSNALDSKWQGLGPLVKEYLEASQAAQQARDETRQAEKEAQRQRELEAARRLAEEEEARRKAEEQRREEAEARAREQAEAARKSRRQALMLAGMGIVAVILAILAFLQTVSANDNARRAQANANLAGTREAQANTNAQMAATSAAEAKTNAAVAATNEAEAEANAAAAATSARQAVLQQEAAIAARSTAEAELINANQARADLVAVLERQLTSVARTPEETATSTATAPLVAAGTESTPAATPTTTPTATPNRGATATAETLQIQLGQVRATQTAVARRAIIPEGMVRVSAGPFLMGSRPDSPGAARDEMPQRTVELAEFFIDRTEVTNAAYRQCVEANVCAPQAGGDPNYNNNPNFDDHPVIFVSWEGAQAFCRWAGKRLPTEAEWEKAARGTDGRIFPWGNSINVPVSQANVDGIRGGAAAVGSFPSGASPYGALDMIGNLWEWTADWERPTYYAERPDPDIDPPGPSQEESTGRKIIRGGFFNTPRDEARAADRNGVGLGPSFDISFRCAASAG